MTEKKHHITLENGEISLDVLQTFSIKEQLDLSRLRAEQGYKGTRLENIIGEWPGEESIGELLEMLGK